jgi:glycerate 2-kinase
MRDARMLTLGEGNDACQFFQTLGDLVTTSPTLANVNDFRAILVL